MIDKLIARINELNNPSVVGLDPQLSFVPGFIKKAAFSKHGQTPEGAAEAFYEFNKRVIDAVYDTVPAVKPQIAMYELFGAAGIACYIKTIKYAKEKGLIVIGDIKRGDIASTAAAYSDGHIGLADIDGESAAVFDEDFITVNPYLGADSVEPFLSNVAKRDKGLFVLVKTSNPGGADIQDLPITPTATEAKTVAEYVGQMVSKLGEPYTGKYGYSDVCAVVGATYPEAAVRLRSMMPHTFFLVPGYGAQGGDAKSLRAYFDRDQNGAIVNSSRGIIAAHTGKYKGMYLDEDFTEAVKRAVSDMKNDITEALANARSEREGSL